jgi:Anti-sigma factor NepR
MPEKTPGGSRKRARKPSGPNSASPPAAPADRYIAEQLKAMYDAVAAEPVPDQLLELLNRLGSDAEE